VSEEVKINLGYKPRPLQSYLHNVIRRFNVLVCHRRFGKTVFALRDTIDRGLNNTLNRPQYAYICPTYRQAKMIAWEYLKEYIRPIPSVKVHEQELRVDIYRPAVGDHIRFMLLGAESPDSLRGIYLDGCIFDEYALMEPAIWSESVRPALSDRLGWATFIGTPKGQNSFYDMYRIAKKEMDAGNPEWFAYLAKASATGIISKKELDAARVTMSEEEYNQEYECDFTAQMSGSFYARLLRDIEANGQITSVPYDASVLVDTYWDLGMDDSTVIWFVQTVGKEVHIIDYYEDSGKGLKHYAGVLANKQLYTYGVHHLPHDAAARELGTGQTRQEILQSYNVGRVSIVARQGVEDGIEAVRTLLPRCWFDGKRTADGIEALKHYQKQWDAKLKIYKQTPLHDWSSHAADAFRTLATGIRASGGISDTQYRKNMEKYRLCETNYSPFA